MSINSTLGLVRKQLDATMDMIHGELMKTHNRSEVNFLQELLKGLAQSRMHLEKNHAEINYENNPYIVNPNTTNIFSDD